MSNPVGEPPRPAAPDPRVRPFAALPCRDPAALEPALERLGAAAPNETLLQLGCRDLCSLPGFAGGAFEWKI